MDVRVNDVHIQDLKALLTALGFQYHEREMIMRDVQRNGYIVITPRKELIIRAYKT